MFAKKEKKDKNRIFPKKGKYRKKRNYEWYANEVLLFFQAFTSNKLHEIRHAEEKNG